MTKLPGHKKILINLIQAQAGKRNKKHKVIKMPQQLKDSLIKLILSLKKQHQQHQELQQHQQHLIKEHRLLWKQNVVMMSY